jgi:hypothetical protein
MSNWIGPIVTYDHDIDFYIHNDLMAKKGDRLEVHGEHDDGELAVKGTRNESYFWVNPDHVIIELK